MEWLTKIKRFNFQKFAVYTLLTFALVCAILVASIIYIYETYSAQNSTTVVIPKGQGTLQTLRQLHNQNVLPHPYVVITGTLLTQGRIRVLAGHYNIEENSPPSEIMLRLALGDVLQHKITFAEGLTAHDILTKINTTQNLTGPNEITAEEGTLFPSTYHIPSHYNKKQLVKTLKQTMSSIANDVFLTNKNPFIHSVHDLITLASIIEKEAANHQEMPRISAVFVNRLKRRMRLQSDPTAIYGITQGKTKLNRLPTRKDLLHESKYNTYRISGLPIGPICCPGLAALKAAANPLKTNDLYFILEESGKSHLFSVTYRNHLNHVNRIQRKKRLDQRRR